MEDDDVKKLAAKIGWDDSSFAFRHGFTVSDEILTAIGCAVVCQSHIEMQFAMLISHFLNVEENKVVALTSGMSFKNLAAALSSMVLLSVDQDSQAYQEFKTLMGKLQHFEEFRNQISHSVWAHSQDFASGRATRIKTTARQGRGVRHDREEVEIARISEALNEATQSLMKLVLLVSALAGKPIQWPSSAELG